MKKIVFMTGTRADFGKLKNLILKVQDNPSFQCHTFVTGMHLLGTYGHTYTEVERAGIKNLYKFINQQRGTEADIILSNTILGFSNYIQEIKPDLIIVHGDRVEALACAIVGSFNSILVGHIEGGEVSGTLDELTRHAISKLAHIHFVSNELAKKRLLQMGEREESVFTIGSPDIDVMLNGSLPEISEVKKHYDIGFDSYYVLLYHPVTSEYNQTRENVKKVVAGCLSSGFNFVVIYPNNDKGSEIILDEYEAFRGNSNFRVLPSMRFESFLSLLKHSKGIVGNSSAGIREACVFGVPALNIGSRQDNRSKCESILHVNEDETEICKNLVMLQNISVPCSFEFGDGTSTAKFIKIIEDDEVWETPQQKQFVDLLYGREPI
ncbi:UDP-N-acetylglucosamine 2-epimerase [Maridesulfovibrio sp.]|uniref:UDP-N-acetylglucosamine 2-epimerase n=1 Tax=Maridesulfovibrio sp. TaxID=2795000 RepID=UPI002A1876C9|nr:UDP-N-acetylglucosamine 2-epimerase [Maridesulfovibrio sp.]